MYYDYFGLSEAPFSIAPNPEYLFMTERHQEALAHLYHGIESEAGFVLLTGDIGTGKTTVCRCFLENLSAETEVAFILNPFLDGRELLQVICQELNINDVPETATLRQLTDLIYRHLLANHAKGKNTVLLIDEAQHIHIKVLELIRLLTNLETATQKLLKIILVGQPELNDMLAKPELTQLSQRITARYHIKPLSYDETVSYISYRLRMAGYASEKKLFPANVVKSIFKFTGGVPRLINVICDRVLLGTYVKNKAAADHTILKNAIREIHGEDAFKPKWSFSWRNITALVGVLLIGVLFGLFYPSLLQRSDPSSLLAFAKRYLPEASSDEAPQILEAEPQPLTRQPVVVAPVSSELSTQPVVADRPTGILAKTRYYPNQSAAMNELIRVMALDADGDFKGCAQLDQKGWQCREAVVETWQEFLQYNRPAVLVLNSVDGHKMFIPITGATNNSVQISSQGNMMSLPLVDFVDDWSGNFIYLWQPPIGFEEFIYFDSSANVVNWLAAAFARMDNQTALLSNGQYNSLLKQRVILFQKQNGLAQDGIAGIQTLLKLNEKLGLAITLKETKANLSALDRNVN